QIKLLGRVVVTTSQKKQNRRQLVALTKKLKGMISAYDMVEKKNQFAELTEVNERFFVNASAIRLSKYCQSVFDAAKQVDDIKGFGLTDADMKLFETS